MKLYGTIAVRVQATDILRAPGFFDKLRRAFGGRPDLRTGKMRSAIAGVWRAFELHRVQFEAFVDRLGAAIAAAMPTATVEVETAEARVVRPDANQPQEQAQRPAAAYYDPYVAYYPSPLGFVAET